MHFGIGMHYIYSYLIFSIHNAANFKRLLLGIFWTLINMTYRFTYLLSISLTWSSFSSRLLTSFFILSSFCLMVSFILSASLTDSVSSSILEKSKNSNMNILYTVKKVVTRKKKIKNLEIKKKKFSLSDLP